MYYSTVPNTDTRGVEAGGQELVISQVQTTMLSFGMIPVGGHAPAFLGGTLVNSNDSVDEDEFGLNTARKVGQRVGEAALRLTMPPESSRSGLAR